MEFNIYFAAIILLLLFAVFDLVVGVSNDAVNFLNSSIGSKVASRTTIMIVASLGIIAGVTFSGGMMEVARKGIFHPGLFTMPELLTLFLGVMLADIILLDTFNTFGLPTSTTVSIVFELLGGAVALSIIKIVQSEGSISALGDYINTAKAMMIIFGILLSVFLAFFSGAIVQFFTRLCFTFDYIPRLKKFGAIWGGIAISSIAFFILIKGAKGSAFMTPELKELVTANAHLILLFIFIVSVIVLQILIMFSKINILKPIILTGTFALALAFAANDLVNFIGVPLAGFHSFKVAFASSNPLTVNMGALSEKVQSEQFLLLIAGIIMVITLWFSKKAKSMSETELSLGQQSDDGAEKYESTMISRIIVRMASSLFKNVLVFIPFKAFFKRRLNTEAINKDQNDESSFDLLRASVNLMVASAVVSFATSLKLPLSTTYVTFMVSMGSSFSDQAWGRESAVYRITGVLTVVGGWFLTAFMAFSLSFIFANIIKFTGAYGTIALLFIAIFIIKKSHSKHDDKLVEQEKFKIFNLKKITNPKVAKKATFNHMGLFIGEIRNSLDITFKALFVEDYKILKQEKKKIKKIQAWANIITANIFKVLRLQQASDSSSNYRYAQTIRRLQKLSDGQRDIVLRAFNHTRNNHEGLLPTQKEELESIISLIDEILLEVEKSFKNNKILDSKNIMNKDFTLKSIAEKLNNDQISRILDNSSKTRLTILYYAIIGNCMMISKQNLKLLDIFNESFSE